VEPSVAALVAQAARAPLSAATTPPPRFADATFATYRPDPAFPSQARAAAHLREARGWPWRRRALYLDGPFGVGKTHLLAATYHAAPAPKAFAAFPDLAFTLIRLGVGEAARRFRAHRLLCVDELELDDPANLLLVLGLLRRLAAWPARTRVVATSTVEPSRLGVGRFDAERHRAELRTLADLFEVIPIEGRDHRRVAPRPPAVRPGPTVELSHAALTAALAALHPLQYGALAAPIARLVLHDLRPIADEPDALRFVHFVDKVYDLEVGLATPGAAPVDALFGGAYADGPFAAKYARCRSRLGELLAP
jgi:cell division protein ZapE